MDLKEKILKDIEKTGFVTELKVVSALIEKDWSTEHGITYEDLDENRNREIDVVASKVKYVNELGLRVTFYLVIEVKKSERPWIIFTTKSHFATLGWRIMNRCSNLYKWVVSDKFEKGGHFMPILDVDCIRKESVREYTFKVGKAFHELEKSQTDKSKIYEALICSGKAAHYFKNRFKQEETTNFDVNKEVDIQIYLPIVVLDGLLFEVSANNAGQIDVKEANFIPVEMRYSSQKYRFGSWDTEFFPDVIRFDYLNEHLENIEAWRISMVERVSEILKELGKQPDKRFDI